MSESRSNSVATRPGVSRRGATRATRGTRCAALTAVVLAACGAWAHAQPAEAPAGPATRPAGSDLAPTRTPATPPTAAPEATPPGTPAAAPVGPVTPARPFEQPTPGAPVGSPAADNRPVSDITPGGFTLRQTYGAANSPSRTVLMSLFDQVPLGSQGSLGSLLDQWKLKIYGHAEASITHNFDNPHSVAGVDNFGRVFDVYNNRGQINQLTLNFERLVDPTAKQFDVGGRVELMYGTDATFIHSSGLGDSRNFFTGPGNQFDLTQAYVDFALPVGDGLRLRAGKFVYFKQLDPNASVFYSHSFTFGGALPFTLTGIYGTYQFGDHWLVDGGISRGWDQSLRDNNGAIDAFGRVKYTFNDNRTSVSGAIITGPEQFHDNGHYRTVLDATLSHEVNRDLTLLADAVYGYQARPDSGTTVNSTAQWYGLSGYAVQRLNEYVSVAGRLEWYRDDGGYTTGLNQVLYEATVGATVTPFPHDFYGQNFKLRPEVRFDYSTKDYFDARSKHEQITFAIDAIYNF